LIDIFEQVHSAGYTYNDLKLDNILVGDAEFSMGSRSEIRLIDFGFAAKYLNKKGEHFE
jgi:serine/threonine protein kinase